MGDIHTFDHTKDFDPDADDDEVLRRMVLDIEAVCDARGWEDEDNQNTFLGIVFAEIPSEDFDPDGVGVTWVSPLPAPPYVLRDLPTYLPMLATLAPMLRDSWLCNMQSDSIVVGTLATFEGWSTKIDKAGMTPEQEEARRTRTIHLLPDRTEVRSVLLATFDGRLIAANRTRGEEPKVDITDGAKVEFRGTIPGALRALTKALCGPLWTGDE